MSIHDGHRERMRARFLKEGLDNFSEIQVLEFLLFYIIPRRDTNPIAHALMDRFGSVSQVMEAPVEELQKVPGIGPNSALMLNLITSLARYYVKNRAEKVKILSSIEDCGEYLKGYFLGRRVEMVYLLCLDAKCKVLNCVEVGQGSVNSANVPVRRVVELALGQGATSVVLAHNHPSGIALPSGEDIATTRRLAVALSTVDIHLVDHIIVADDDYVSLAQSGYRFDDCVIA